MKVLLFMSSYSLIGFFQKGFESLGYEVNVINVDNFLPKKFHRLHSAVIPRLTYKIRDKWESYYLSKAFQGYRQAIDREEPDIVLVYNDQLLNKEGAEYISTRAELFFFLGDNPFFLTKRAHFFDALYYANHIFSPDSNWCEQLERVGIENCSFLYTGFNEDIYYPVEPTEEQRKRFEGELCYVGRSYKEIWGKKRAAFLNSFTKYDFKFWGPENWRRFFNDFPDLEKAYRKPTTYLTDADINAMASCNKIYPIDANPGLINGLHIRIAENIGSQILPVVEYRKDMDRVFNSVKIPVIKNYKKADDIIQYYLKNDNERIELAAALRKLLLDDYNPKISAEKMIEKIT